MARPLTSVLDIDRFVPMLEERFGRRYGGDWPVEVEGRTEMAIGIVGLGAADREWIDEQTPARARRVVHPTDVRFSLDELHRYDDLVFDRLVVLEGAREVAPGWNCAVDVELNRVVVVLPDTTDELLDIAELTDLVPGAAVAVTTAAEAGTRVRALVAPRRHERSVGARALGAAMTVVGEIVHGRNDDSETEVVAEAPEGDPPLDLDFGALDPLD